MPALVTFLCSLAILLSSCTPRAIVVAPIAPKAVKVAESAKATAKSADKVKVSVAKVKDQSSKLQKDLIEGMLAADALRKGGLGMATQEQLDANYVSWSKANERSLFLKEYIKGAEIDTSDLQAIANKGVMESEEMAVEAVKTDKSTEKLKTDIVKQADNAALGRNVKWIVGILIALFMVYLLIRFLVPAIMQVIKPPLT